jgi:hypothetical protein
VRKLIEHIRSAYYRVVSTTRCENGRPGRVERGRHRRDAGEDDDPRSFPGGDGLDALALLEAGFGRCEAISERGVRVVTRL